MRSIEQKTATDILQRVRALSREAEAGRELAQILVACPTRKGSIPVKVLWGWQRQARKVLRAAVLPKLF